ncbi:MAG: hypothetical protein KBS60_00665 [Phascolarctobacterium sp.]|nr:hypothetical protein [Candidatus Phascolarctobacterium caballi]
MKKFVMLIVLLFVTNFVNAAELGKIEYNGHKVTLFGEKLDSGFCYDFLLRVETEGAPYMVNPAVTGGYYPDLKLVKLSADEQQLFFSVRQGGQNSISEYRIFADRNNKLKPIFGLTESTGIISSIDLEKNKMQINLLNGVSQSINLNEKIYDKIENDLLKGYKPDFEGMYSLLSYDGDNDGVQELYATQRVDMSGQELCHMAVRMDLQRDDSWKMSHYVLQLPVLSEKDENINRGVTTLGYEVYPEKIYVEEANGAIPKFYGIDKKVSKKINDYFCTAYQDNLSDLFGKHAAMGFEIVVSYENILSVRFIGGEKKYNTFLHVNPLTGDILTIEDMFIVSSDFLKTMSILSQSKHKYVKKDLKNWFVKGVQLHVVLDENGAQRAEQFSLAAFESFLSPKNTILQRKVN